MTWKNLVKIHNHCDKILLLTFYFFGGGISESRREPFQDRMEIGDKGVCL